MEIGLEDTTLDKFSLSSSPSLLVQRLLWCISFPRSVESQVLPTGRSNVDITRDRDRERTTVHRCFRSME